MYVFFSLWPGGKGEADTAGDWRLGRQLGLVDRKNVMSAEFGLTGMALLSTA